MKWSLCKYPVIRSSIVQNDHLPPAAAEPQAFDICALIGLSLKWLLEKWAHRCALQGVTLSHWASQWEWQTDGFLLRSWVILMETKPLIANSVWSQLSLNLRPAPPLIIADQASHPALPESIQPSRAASTCGGINDSRQEIPLLILIKFFFSKSSRLTLFRQKRGAHVWSTSTLMQSVERGPQCPKQQRN